MSTDMKSIFDASTREGVLSRLGNLTADTVPAWGTMTASQMLAHLTQNNRMPLGEAQVTKSPMRFLGPVVRWMVLGKRPFPKGAPTAPEFRITDQRDFAQEKVNFTDTFTRLAAAAESIRNPVHAAFGKMRPDQWGRLVHKHIDHHFTQFGV